MRIQRLVKYIESHGHKATAVTDGVTNWIEAETRFAHTSYTEIDSLEPSLQSVRDWLGY